MLDASQQYYHHMRESRAVVPRIERTAAPAALGREPRQDLGAPDAV